MIDDIVTFSADWNLCSGTKEQNEESDISIMPNPFTNQAALISNAPLHNVCISIYMPSGLYYLVVTEGNKIHSRTKFMITD